LETWSSSSSTTTNRRFISSRERATRCEALPYPTSSRKGSPMLATLRAKWRRARACRKALFCISASSEPTAYAHPNTERKMENVTHIRCAVVKG
jgi:hypothetical protein